ncbi:HIT family protein [Rhodococcoides fascians A25f]|nr:HIT family protein [Rhodococcus fascians A25f]
MDETCLLCREVTGEIELPGDFLHASDRVVAFHLPEQSIDGLVLRGHSMVSPIRHTANFGTLTDVEAAEVGQTVTAVSRTLTRLGAEYVYVAAIGHSHPHLHVHVIPRWPGVDASVEWFAVRDEPGPHRVDGLGAESFAAEMKGLMPA